MVLRPRELSRTVALFPARTPTLPPATHTNSYALGSRDVLLVEPATPYDDELRAWTAWARSIGAQGRTVIAVVATHHHRDHIGGARELVRDLGLPLWAHAETAKRIDVPVARTLADGETLTLRGADAAEERWTVLHTPGHAPGHVCLWSEEERTVVVGDMVASVGTILVDPVDGDMRVYIEQLERLAALDARLALPAHGEPIDEPTKLFRHYVAHRRMREGKVLAALAARGAAGASAQELVPEAYDDAPAAVWPLAVLSVEAHLVKLVGEGRVRTQGAARYIAS